MISHHGIGRNTKAYETVIGPVTLYFSYNTLIGVHTGTQFARRENHWGPTTGRHINEFGLRDAMIMSERDLEGLAELAIHRYLEDRYDHA